jgi:hypothetical protein
MKQFDESISVYKNTVYKTRQSRELTVINHCNVTRQISMSSYKTPMNIISDSTKIYTVTSSEFQNAQHLG